MSEVEIVTVDNASETSDTINTLWTVFTQKHFVVILYYKLKTLSLVFFTFSYILEKLLGCLNIKVIIIVSYFH